MGMGKMREAINAPVFANPVTPLDVVGMVFCQIAGVNGLFGGEIAKLALRDLIEFFSRRWFHSTILLNYKDIVHMINNKST